jgi:hypothetical protein
VSSFFDDSDAFFHARGIRRHQRDGSWMEDAHDFGMWWRDPQGEEYRLTWIGPHRGWREPHALPAGELYLARLGPPFLVSGLSAIEFLCIVPPTDEDEGGSVLRDGNAVLLLDGWEDMCGKPRSADWVRDRAAEARLLWGMR